MNKTANPVIEYRTLAHLLEDVASRYDKRTALQFKPGLVYQRWSYRRLYDESLRVAALLHERGVAGGDRVVIWGPNSPQWVAVYFACALTGIVAVPIDMRSAPDFVQRVVEQTEPRLAFTSRFLPSGQPGLDLETIWLEDLPDLSLHMAPFDGKAPDPDDLFEIMFTSGTTGAPKGVMLTHANIMSDLFGSRQYVPGDPDFRLLSVLPLSHMFEQTGGLLLPLTSGACITYQTSMQPSALIRSMQEGRINVMLVVPQLLKMLMDGIEREARRQGREKLFARLQAISLRLPFGLRRRLFQSVHKRLGGALAIFFTGGSALDPDLGRKWAALGVRVIQGYGATETSPTISIHPMADPRYDSVGLPIPNETVKIAADGEILVKGPNVTQGYWRSPDRTAAAFEDGWYRTGDQGYLDPRGYLHLLGRTKDMIALASGQKVYPEDIEAELTKHPSVVDAVVVGLQRPDGPEVHAVLILNDGGDAEEVVGWANQRLADHQQIRGFTLWPEEDFPRTHTLKVRKNLVVDYLLGKAPAPPAQSPVARPKTSVAEGLTAALAELSGLPSSSIKPESSLGGDLNLDSLKRVELLSLLEETLGLSLDDSSVDGKTTVAELTLMAGGEQVAPSSMSFPRWSRSWWCCPLRGVIQRALVTPIVAWLYRIELRGKEVLRDLQGPVIFVANHNLGLDNGIFLKSLPSAWRRKLAIAAAAELWHNPLLAVVNPLVGNAFPFSRDGAVRASMDNLGRIMDQGWSVLIYPEGQLTIGGPIQEFKTGIGMLAVGTEAPIQPMCLSVTRFGFPRRLPFLRSGRVTLAFGAPLRFTSTASYIDATATIESAVRELEMRDPGPGAKVPALVGS
jgi:long-chain acyl-CoA synthetase